MRKLFITLFSMTLLFVLSGCGSGNKISLIPSQDTIELHSSWTDPGAKVIVGSSEKNIYSKDNVDTSKLGVYKLNYFYEDKIKTYHIIRYVIVVDQTNPIITLKPGVDTIKIGEEWVDSGAIVIDNSNENLTISVIGSIDNKTSGTYEIKYEATDSSGNKAIVIRYVDVIG